MRQREFLGGSKSAGGLGADRPHPVWAIFAQGSVASELNPRGALPRDLPTNLHPSRKAVWGVSGPMCPPRCGRVTCRGNALSRTGEPRWSSSAW